MALLTDEKLINACISLHVYAPCRKHYQAVRIMFARNIGVFG